MERHLRLHVDARLGHGRTEAALTERAERLFALPRIDVVVVVALPPREVGETAGRALGEPTALLANGVVLLRRHTFEDDVCDECNLGTSLSVAARCSAASHSPVRRFRITRDPADAAPLPSGS